MNIFKNTQSKLVVTNMNINLKYITDGKLTILDIIEHLRINKDIIFGESSRYNDLNWVCEHVLSMQQNETIELDHTAIIKEHPNVRARTFFYPSCRIIRIDMSNGTRAIQGSVTGLSKDHIECGYEIKVKPGCHTVLVIKIEHMTDSSCYATWTLLQ